jgi:hypothetical protein
MDIEKIILYNSYHNGDIFVSRNLVKFTIENISSKEYTYIHLNSSKLLQDIPKLKHIREYPPENIKYSGWKRDENNVLWFNTWYNSYNQQEFGGCTIQTLFNIFKRGLKENLDFDLPGEPIDYLPTIDFNYFDISKIDNFLSFDPREKVLISNCDVLSGQSENFDFNPIIDYISDIFPQICFIITNYMNNKLVVKQNIYYFESLIKDDNLNEISYLSKFCKILIGRNSGPHTFCFIKENLMDKDKTFVCISHENFGIVGSVNAEMVCFQNYNIGKISSLIEETIRKKLL